MIKRLHLHLYRNEISTQNRFSEYEFCHLESIMVHLSFKNVSAALANNRLYYEASSFITLPDGYYDLESLNRILKKTGSLYYKLMIGDDSQTYRLWKFGDSNTWGTEDTTSATDKTTAVQNLGLLNQHIYNMTFFNGIRVRINAFNEFETQQSANQITSTSEIDIPTTAPRGTQQWLYFTPPIVFGCDVTNTLRVEFFTWNNQPIEFHPSHEPILVFKFE